MKHPDIFRKLISVSTAMTRWIAAGRPRPTPEQIVNRLAACDACPHQKETKGVKRCGLCGCSLNASRMIGTVERPGKVEMSTEQCPDRLGCKVDGCPGEPRWLPLV